ncbi:MAG TPA: RNA-binding cell elongation regulator Jag/EloR [Candidatus Binatia bacterium]|nr:RNA-binding cell elongation regulator Jag/EloR [Candidatus Binatia bacterium]
MNVVEVEGTTIDEAIESALQQLAVTRDQVEVDIIASPTKGVLGIGGRKAKVRVSRRQPVVFETESAGNSQPPKREGPATVDTGLAARARALLQDILDHMGFAVTVDVAERDDTIELSIRGDQSGVLIGRHGQTLDALEYFLHRALGRDDAAAHLSVDCEQYRVRRRSMLEAIAARLAQEAKNKQRAMSMESLSPRDRRIVHLALEDEPGVTTRSSGEGHYRDLLILPDGAPPPTVPPGERRNARPPRRAARTGPR